MRPPCIAEFSIRVVSFPGVRILRPKTVRLQLAAIYWLPMLCLSCAQTTTPTASRSPEHATTTTAPTHTATDQLSFLNADSSIYTLDGLRHAHEQMTHDSDKVVIVSLFDNGHMGIVQHCYVYSDGGKGMIRYTEYAIQGGGGSGSNNPMPASERTALDAAISRLPAGQTFSNDADAFLVSWSSGGKWTTKTYNRTQLPQEVLDLCDLVNIPHTWL